VEHPGLEVDRLQVCDPFLLEEAAAVGAVMVETTTPSDPVQE
jgi:hypothetical protein